MILRVSSFSFLNRRMFTTKSNKEISRQQVCRPKTRHSARRRGTARIIWNGANWGWSYCSDESAWIVLWCAHCKSLGQWLRTGSHRRAPGLGLHRDWAPNHRRLSVSHFITNRPLIQSPNVNAVNHYHPFRTYASTSHAAPISPSRLTAVTPRRRRGTGRCTGTDPVRRKRPTESIVAATGAVSGSGIIRCVLPVCGCSESSRARQFSHPAKC